MHKQNARIRAHTHTHVGVEGWGEGVWGWRVREGGATTDVPIAHPSAPGAEACQHPERETGRGGVCRVRQRSPPPTPYVKVGVVKGRDVSISEREIVFQLTKPRDPADTSNPLILGQNHLVILFSRPGVKRWCIFGCPMKEKRFAFFKKCFSTCNNSSESDFRVLLFFLCYFPLSHVIKSNCSLAKTTSRNQSH